MQLAQFRFHVDRNVNLFHHTVALYPESYRSEGSAFDNSKYRDDHADLRTPSLDSLIRKLFSLGNADWDFVGLSLAGRLEEGQFETQLQQGFGGLARIWAEILQESWKGYHRIWQEVQKRLDLYKSAFESQWKSLSNEVISQIRIISESPWNPDYIDVYFVDSLYGGASLIDRVLLAPVENLEIEKKLLTHELAEGAYSICGLSTKLRAYGIDQELAHTIIDATAYFALKPYLNQEYSGRLRPKSTYYPEADRVLSVFEERNAGTSSYSGFDSILDGLRPEPFKPG